MVVRNLGEATLKWLDGVLSAKGFVTPGSVKSVDASPRVYSGAVADLARLRVAYNRNSESDVPIDFLLKTTKEGLQEEVLGLGRKEVEFYRAASELDVALNIPRCYDTQIDEETGHSHILMEDLSVSHFQLQQPLPPSHSDSCLVVDSLAQLHAQWWESSKLGVEFGHRFDQAAADKVRKRLKDSLPSFMDFFGSSLLSAQRKMYEQVMASDILTRRDARLDGLSRVSILHGDTNVGNFLFPRSDRSGRAMLIDWQFWGIDVPSNDLSFFIVLKWSSRRRAESEVPVLKRYYQALLERGVQGYSWDDLWRDYRESTILATLTPIGQHRRQLHPASVWAGVECASAAFEDLGCAELL